MPDRVRVREVLSPKESDVSTDHGMVSFEFHTSTKASHNIKRTGYDYRNGDFDGLRGALEALNLHPKHQNASYTLPFYRPVPSRLCNPSMVATVHWLTKMS